MLRQFVLLLGAWAVVGTSIVAAENSEFSMRSLLKQNGKGNNKGNGKGNNKGNNKGNSKCKDKHGKGCPTKTSHCPSYSAERHVDGTTTITVDYSCLKDGSISYVVVDEDCDGHCDGKMEDVYGSSATYKYKLDKYACKGTVCIYAKDGQFEHVPGEHEGVPSCAYSSDNQLCQICPYKLEIIAEHAKCSEGDKCTGPGTCDKYGVCKPGTAVSCKAPNATKCEKLPGVCVGGVCKYTTIKDGTTRCGGTDCEPKVCNSYGTCVAGPVVSCTSPDAMKCEKLPGKCVGGKCEYTKIKDGTTRCGGTACEPKVCNSYGTCVAGYNRCH